MTEKEAKAIKWIKNVRDDAVVTLDHIQKNEPNVSPMLYEGRKQKAETIMQMYEELLKYRAIGTSEEFKALKEKSVAKKPAPIDYEKYIDVVENAKFLRGAYWCPNCKHTVRSGAYCDDCGQKLDWQ